MSNTISKLILCLSMFFSLTANSADVAPYVLIAGSSVVGARENNKEDIHLGFNAVFNDLIATENIKCEFKDFETSDELVDALRKNQINGMFGSPIEFLQSESLLLSNPIISGKFGNQMTTRIIVLVRKESELNSLEQLSGKKLSTQKWLLRDIGGVYLNTSLLESKLPQASEFFSEIVTVDTSNRALVNLFFKKVDAAMLSEREFNIAAELNPQLRAQIKVIASSDYYLSFIAATSINTPVERVSAIKRGLFNLQKSSKGKSVLALLKVDGFQEINSNELNNVRELLAKYKHLKAIRNVK